MPLANETVGTDQELWNAFRKGEEQAFAQIARQYYPGLFSYGAKFSRDREFVNDCVQDLFLELWSMRESIGDTQFVKFYLFKSLRRKIHRESIRRNRLGEEQELEWDYEILFDESFEQQLITLETNEQRLKALNQQLESLSKRQQEAIYLKFFENLDNNSIAEVMNITPQAVANLIYRSIRDLKERL